ncbi:hypothetical protein PV04_10307 [Phialophora macrospora]|uniref:Uncharacterized protein n=1 Tax=Phialophora macrospora TaxID=1851006 RepID=A0A0D2CEG3_9EURO|nr:hypothetical protein PV04_10307 [Phialophora macrospora]
MLPRNKADKEVEDGQPNIPDAYYELEVQVARAPQLSPQQLAQRKQLRQQLDQLRTKSFLSSIPMWCSLTILSWANQKLPFKMTVGGKETILPADLQPRRHYFDADMAAFHCAVRTADGVVHHGTVSKADVFNYSMGMCNFIEVKDEKPSPRSETRQGAKMAVS